jgi:hypothetical protein
LPTRSSSLRFSRCPMPMGTSFRARAPWSIVSVSGLEDSAMCKPDPGPCRLRPVPLGRVAEWQTRTVQVRVSVRTWGFNSPLAHMFGGPSGSPSPLPSILGRSPRPPRCELLRTQRGSLPIDQLRSWVARTASVASLPGFPLPLVTGGVALGLRSSPHKSGVLLRASERPPL